jgi:enamine deaminase RidA (YjgF/YER057c/UK114 family)
MRLSDSASLADWRRVPYMSGMIPNTKTTREMYPGCRVTAAGVMDRRTWQARLVRQTRDELFAHCGGNPDARQTRIIEEVIRQTLLLADFDARAARGEPVEPEVYLAASTTAGRGFCSV